LHSAIYNGLMFAQKKLISVKTGHNLQNLLKYMMGDSLICNLLILTALNFYI